METRGFEATLTMVVATILAISVENLWKISEFSIQQPRVPPVQCCL